MVVFGEGSERERIVGGFGYDEARAMSLLEVLYELDETKTLHIQLGNQLGDCSLSTHQSSVASNLLSFGWVILRERRLRKTKARGGGVGMGSGARNEGVEIVFNSPLVDKNTTMELADPTISDDGAVLPDICLGVSDGHRLAPKGRRLGVCHT